jgi:topoisomerase-4 subunit A
VYNKFSANAHSKRIFAVNNLGSLTIIVAKVSKIVEFEEINPDHSGHVDGMYQAWFLDYASYVILERAVPALEDGLKPVQRRILHALNEMDDGRFNKVANVIGATMQYHPHGDMSIGDALVAIGQKDLLLDTQGNWGDVRTGDSAAAPRYIETRLSKFALDIAFNDKTTDWQLSYDGRKREPTTLPMKFPLLLVQGAEGIAVGLSTKILPHNFCEVIEAAIKYLRGKKFELYPDFQTGGFIDVQNYNDGRRGGKIRVRARIEERDAKTVLIKSVPFGVTTTSLIDSIIKANDAGKIKIKKITDNTAAEVEIEVQIAPGVSVNQTIDALYAFTSCEQGISPNICVIDNEQPKFIGASELLRSSVDNTKNLLKRELEIRLGELQEKWHYTSLEKIFFEEKIYKELEKKHATWEKVLDAIAVAFKPFEKMLKRDITREDIIKLCEKPVRRIYKLDIDELNEQIKKLNDEIKKTKQHLNELVEYTIAYFTELLKKYGKGRERHTEIRVFDTIAVSHIAIANTKVYMNRADGFVGTGLKKDEFLVECNDSDLIIGFTKDGKYKVVKISDKVFIGKDIIHADVFKKNDDRTGYNAIYVDGKTGVSYAKRFNVTGITMNKEYDITRGSDKSKLHYFTANPNSESEVVTINLRECKAKIKSWEFDFAELAMKGRSSMGNQVTKYPVKNVKQKSKGKSTLGGKQIWFDDATGRLSLEETESLLGSFNEDDRILAVYNDGMYEVTNTDMVNRYDIEKLVLIEKYKPTAIISAIYYDGDKGAYFAKRFKLEVAGLAAKTMFIKEGEHNFLEWISTHAAPEINIMVGKTKKDSTITKISLTDFVDVAGWKSVGTKLCGRDLIEIETIPAIEGDNGEAPTLF